MNIWYFILGLLIGLGVGAADLYGRRKDKANHAKCIAHVASVTSNQAVARALRAAADDYDSVEGQTELIRIRNAIYQTQLTGVDADSSIPALWLREHADQIDPS